jgi:hypothetical protein
VWDMESTTMYLEVTATSQRTLSVSGNTLLAAVVFVLVLHLCCSHPILFSYPPSLSLSTSVHIAMASVKAFNPRSSGVKRILQEAKEISNDSSEDLWAAPTEASHGLALSAAPCSDADTKPQRTTCSNGTLSSGSTTATLRVACIMGE